jgi:hypothetical protein
MLGRFPKTHTYKRCSFRRSPCSTGGVAEASIERASHRYGFGANNIGGALSRSRRWCRTDWLHCSERLTWSEWPLNTHTHSKPSSSPCLFTPLYNVIAKLIAINSKCFSLSRSAAASSFPPACTPLVGSIPTRIIIYTTHTSNTNFIYVF